MKGQRTGFFILSLKKSFTAFIIFNFPIDRFLTLFLGQLSIFWHLCHYSSHWSTELWSIFHSQCFRILINVGDLTENVQTQLPGSSKTKNTTNSHNVLRLRRPTSLLVRRRRNRKSASFNVFQQLGTVS